MPTSRTTLGLIVLLLASVGLSQAPPAAGKPLKAQDEIRGKFEDDKDLPKMKAVPPGGVVADQATFTRLWTTWKGEAVPPKIDFEKQLVLVGTTQCAANRIFGGFSLTADGDLRGVFGSTLIGGPGFAWVMYVYSREGVKTVNGKPLAKP